VVQVALGRFWAARSTSTVVVADEFLPIGASSHGYHLPRRDRSGCPPRRLFGIDVLSMGRKSIIYDIVSVPAPRRYATGRRRWRGSSSTTQGSQSPKTRRQETTLSQLSDLAESTHVTFQEWLELYRDSSGLSVTEPSLTWPGGEQEATSGSCLDGGRGILRNG